jgi:hypothetical protein
MLNFYANRFVELSGWLSLMQLSYLNPAPIGTRGLAPSPLTDESLKRLREQIERAKELAAPIGLTGVVAAADRLLTAIGDPSDQRRDMISNYADGISHLLGEMSVRLKEDLEAHVFLQLSADGAGRYDKAATLFAGAVWDKFVDARYDLEEAVNALALERSTAAVFHLMRVMERALHAVHLCLGLDWPLIGNEKNWGNILQGIRGELVGRGARWPERGAFDELYALLDSVKGCWRNTTMHVEEKYTQDEAGRVYRNVSDFMARLSARMDERGHPLA